AQEFVPHVRKRTGLSVPPRLARTPVWLLDEGVGWPSDLAPATVLLQMSSRAAQDAAHWSRLIEVVGEDPQDRREARQRWRAYEAQGLPVKAVQVGGRAHE
ncbi:MAG: DNA polymerase III subunit chi, partial [Rubrivivax sp.]